MTHAIVSAFARLLASHRHCSWQSAHHIYQLSLLSGSTAKWADGACQPDQNPTSCNPFRPACNPTALQRWLSPTERRTCAHTECTRAHQQASRAAPAPAAAAAAANPPTRPGPGPRLPINLLRCGQLPLAEGCGSNFSTWPAAQRCCQLHTRHCRCLDCCWCMANSGHVLWLPVPDAHMAPSLLKLQAGMCTTQAWSTLVRSNV